MPQEENLGKICIINFQQTIEIVEENITVKFEDFKDNRCPSDVICIWEGFATVTLTFSKDNQSENFALYTNQKKGPAEIVKLGYNIRLVDLNPYPNTNKPVEKKDYKAIIVIEKVE